MLHFPPGPGDAFVVPGRREVLTVAERIASFEHEDPEKSCYLVQTPAGSRWVLMQRELTDGPRWIGRAVPADTKSATPDS
jgi:hypothetical protein